ncbi:MAG: DUF488 family protein [Bacteroidetes bacterium]|nr:DUF488 family protein [Bacteroidota bacterium]
MKPIINIKRVYEDPSKNDGIRILVDRLWPRGLSKDKADVDEWAKELAPTTALRKWFDHKPERWKEFQKEYIAELKKNKTVDGFIETHKKDKRLTLLYATKDEEHTHALVLQQYLEKL